MQDMYRDTALLPHVPGCVVGNFIRRYKRFSIEVDLDGQTLWAHSNNSGSMLGLLRTGTPVLLSPAANPARKLQWTQECIWLPETALPVSRKEHGFWVGVNTAVPNRMLEVAFKAGQLEFAAGYTCLTREARCGQSRLDGLLTGPGLPRLWVECKNVTMVEDNAACFPDAASERGQKHLCELMDIAENGERAAMFYLVQRPDGKCFAPAEYIDPLYAALFYKAVAAGVEIYPYRAYVNKIGVCLGELLPVRTSGKP